MFNNNGKMVWETKHFLPKGPQGQKRPADVIGNAVHVMRIATGEGKGKPAMLPALRLTVRVASREERRARHP